jgi:hypothetical protein
MLQAPGPSMWSNQTLDHQKLISKIGQINSKQNEHKLQYDFLSSATVYFGSTTARVVMSDTSGQKKLQAM